MTKPDGKDRVVRRLYDRRVVLSGAIARQPFDASAPRTGRSSINLSRNLQTETLGCAGRMAHSHGLILTWNSCRAKRIPWCIGPDFV